MALSESVNRWVQSIAIVLAGGWAAYEFIFAEHNKDVYVDLSVGVKVMEPYSLATEEGQVIPIHFDIHSKNIGENDAFTVVGIAVLEGVAVEKAEEIGEEWPMFGAYSETTNLGFAFTDAPIAIAHADFSRTYILFRGESQKTQLTFLADAAWEADMLRYEVRTYTMKRCDGFYPVETCYSARAKVWRTPDTSPCEGAWIARKYLCVEFEMREADPKAPAKKIDEWRKTTWEELRGTRDLTVYTVEGSLPLVPGAKNR